MAEVESSESLLVAILKEITDYNVRLKNIENKLGDIESDLKSLNSAFPNSDLQYHKNWHEKSDKGFFSKLFRGGDND